MTTTIIIVPGYTNSGPEHWQSIIEKKYKNVVRIEQENWESPVRDKWIDGLQKTIESVSSEMFLVGHSCGAITIAQWAAKYTNSRVTGALLVAPADVESSHAPNEIKIQGPIPLKKLSFNSTVVYSNNDEYLSVDRALVFSKAWGSDSVMIENAGHINTAAGYGEWLMGEQLIVTLSGNNLEAKNGYKI
ncbi:RBBP9/YdeN family alpha/beta hydrolase [Fastidiosibacter lacustris]|uniref:RBBP9/YdeN family alpha/beta hydrolase n=1 Tax=Fastidiosibacter lacustris TaxID=2056695 RepID=UPI000E3552F0|nr:alpha/beta hydrolase [Fastidiosibacter lacustris]